MFPVSRSLDAFVQPDVVPSPWLRAAAPVALIALTAVSLAALVVLFSACWDLGVESHDFSQYSHSSGPGTGSTLYMAAAIIAASSAVWLATLGMLRRSIR